MVATAHFTAVETLAAFNTWRDELERLYYQMILEGEKRGSLPPFSATTGNVGWFFDLMIKPAFETKNGISVVCTVGENTVGIALATVDSGPIARHERTAFGHGVYVDQAFRRQGIATQLRQTNEAWLRSHGVEAIIGQVDADDPGAWLSARNHGFERISTVVRKRL